jgi:FlaA1/EpsC-like NDP-sugar epimerase
LNVHKIIGRDTALFATDTARNEPELLDAISGARVLVFGGAGSIGKEVTAQIFARKPAVLHVVDISENNLVALVRDLRSSLGYTGGETQFLPLDIAGAEISCFLGAQKAYDYVLNLAAMKHVRSEKDAYSLMRMAKTNVLDTLTTYAHAERLGAKKFFAVSTDKAKNPANLMGATKRIMEQALFRQTATTAVSTARFANVAFSDGSLLYGFQQRLLLRQPISAPRDVRRYFVTGSEAGLLCLLSVVLGRKREIFFPHLESGLSLLTFSDIACRFLVENGYEPVIVPSEDEARSRAADLIALGKWPCYFFDSDTAGEKPFEEFYSNDDLVDWKRFKDIGVISAPAPSPEAAQGVESFVQAIAALRSAGKWDKRDLVAAICAACPELSHIDAERSLDDKM